AGSAGRRGFSSRRNQRRAGLGCPGHGGGRLLRRQPCPGRYCSGVRHVAPSSDDHAHDAKGRAWAVRDPLSDRRQRGLRGGEVAAKVHDIGKIRVPDSILLKPGKLTVDERRVMETHPRLGFDILRPFSEYAKVLDLVLTHHERYDGLGYPNGTVGRRLLLIA